MGVGADRLGGVLALRSGVATGLVVTGEMELEKGIHGVVGDTLNLASRLADMSGPGEILISENTFKKLRGTYYAREIDLVVVGSDRIAANGDVHRLPAGLVLTGGGSLLAGASELGREVLEMPVRVAALSGPNHAEEVAAGQPTATVVAGDETYKLQHFRHRDLPS